MELRGHGWKLHNKEGIMRGFIYRLGIFIKERGERMAHVKLFGIPVLRWCCGPVIGLGLAIRDSVRNCPIGELRQGII
jgi:hypothetical protein